MLSDTHFNLSALPVEYAQQGLYLSGIHLSICLSAWLLHAATAGLLLWVQWAGDIDITGAEQQSRHTLNAGSATLSAYVQSWMQTCLRGFYSAVFADMYVELSNNQYKNRNTDRKHPVGY